MGDMTCGNSTEHGDNMNLALSPCSATLDRVASANLLLFSGPQFGAGGSWQGSFQALTSPPAAMLSGCPSQMDMLTMEGSDSYCLFA